MKETKWYEHIHVYDNIIDDDKILSLADLIYFPAWEYGNVSNPNYKELQYNIKNDLHKEKSYGIKHIDQYWKMDLNREGLSWEHEELGIYDLWKTIRNHLSKTFKNMSLDIVDCHMTGYTSNMTSIPASQENTLWTILYYVNPLWEIEWGGQTVFYKGTSNTDTILNNEEPDIIKSIYAKPGRFVFFNSSIPYAETPPNSLFPGLKVTLKFNCFSSEMIKLFEIAADPDRPELKLK